MPVATLYADHLPYVRGVVRKLGVCEADVEDVAHEVFCVLLRRTPPEAQSRGIRRWLYQIARRVVSNHRRGRRREAQRRAHAWEPRPADCPEAVAMHRQAKGRLERAVAALPPSTRTLYRMSEVEGLTGPEVARRMGLNPNTAYARVRALRRRLAQVLVLVVLLLAALLLSQAGCTVAEPPSSVVTQAPAAAPVQTHEELSREGSDDRRAAVRGPALGHLAPTLWR